MEFTPEYYDPKRACQVVADVQIPRDLFLVLARALREAAGDHPFQSDPEKLESICIYGVWFYPDTPQ